MLGTPKLPNLNAHLSCMLEVRPASAHLSWSLQDNWAEVGLVSACDPLHLGVAEVREASRPRDVVKSPGLR